MQVACVSGVGTHPGDPEKQKSKISQQKMISPLTLLIEMVNTENNEIILSVLPRALENNGLP